MTIALSPSLRLRPATNAQVPAIIDLVRSVLEEFGLHLELQLEGPDRDLLDIEGHYLRRGGVFDLLIADGAIVGTVALDPGEGGRIELRRMYLDRTQRGRGLGKSLLEHALERARSLGYQEVVLETAPVLAAAIALYRSYGFEPYQGVVKCHQCHDTYRLALSARSGAALAACE